VRSPVRVVKRQADAYIKSMIPSALSAEDTDALIAYARRKFAEERYPYASAQKSAREALDRLEPKPIPEPMRPLKPYVPSTLARRKKRRWKVLSSIEIVGCSCGRVGAGSKTV
jgi:hypothetical protein